MSWIDEARKRCEAASPGPWIIDIPEDHDFREIRNVPWAIYSIDHSGKPIVETDAGAYGPNMHDAEFIADARTDLPRALDEIEKLQAQIYQMYGWLGWHDEARFYRNNLTNSNQHFNDSVDKQD